MADNGNWIMRKRSGGGQLCPSEHTTRGNSFPATSPLVSATDSGIPAESGVSGSTLGQLQARRRRLSQLDPTRVHPAAAPLRPSEVLLLLTMPRSGPPGAPLPGPGDFERTPGIGRGQALPGAGVCGQQANVGGIPPSGGRGVPLDLATPIFMAAGAANYLNGMQGVAPGGASFNPFGFRGWNVIKCPGVFQNTPGVF